MSILNIGLEQMKLQNEKVSRCQELVNLDMKMNGEIIPIQPIDDIPVLPTSIDGLMCVCPNEFYEGFFVARIRKK